MAFIRCESGGGGPVVATATLWTNNSPSNDFAAQEVTLNDSIDNFDLIEIRYKNYVGYTGESGVCWHVEDIKNFGDQKPSSGTVLDNSWSGAMVSYGKVNYRYVRRLIYVDSTHLKFSTGDNETVGTDSGTPQPKACVPLSITGIKYSS